ncbi:hypothetical protein GIB67_018570 [Kingdonia uniflora]|uniref:Uncharacterized protein n=1 Tax=Kingdonia uniflora TaxID=39325 RepID=A0A7J7L8E6_9MAGN|nr:hypothetical protein GIB67_018570 [Kingdonia uniflora]
MDVVLDKLKEFTYTLLYNPQSYCCRHNPIEILKRLQREAFSDTMKLRNRLDKHDRLLSSFYKSTPFNHSTTHLSEEVDVGGALLLVDNGGGGGGGGGGAPRLMKHELGPEFIQGSLFKQILQATMRLQPSLSQLKATRPIPMMFLGARFL